LGSFFSAGFCAFASAFLVLVFAMMKRPVVCE
jgi:hypothetical protein